MVAVSALVVGRVRKELRCVATVLVSSQSLPQSLAVAVCASARLEHPQSEDLGEGSQNTRVDKHGTTFFCRIVSGCTAGEKVVTQRIFCWTKDFQQRKRCTAMLYPQHFNHSCKKYVKNKWIMGALSVLLKSDGLLKNA